MDLEKAKATGAMALFDEKYESEVRVVSMGNVSKELCGGTHVSNTSQIGVFKIVSEESIGSGIRRITVKTSYQAYQQYVSEEKILDRALGMLKLTSYEGLNDRLEQLLKENNSLKKTLEKASDLMLNSQADQLVGKAEPVNGHQVVVELVSGQAADVKTLAEKVLAKLTDGIVLLYNQNEGKAFFVAGCSAKAISDGIKASDLVRQAAQVCGGNGGGRPDMATAGGKDASKLQQAAAAVRSTLGL
jgi:alanyl-tRNA synthetase